MKKKYCFILLCCLAAGNTLFAQSQKVKLADEYLNDFKVSKAIQIYEGELAKNPSDDYLLRKLIVSYNQSGQREKETEAYEKLMRKEDKITDQDFLAFAKHLSRQGKHEEATNWYRRYAEKHPDEEWVKLRMNSHTEIASLKKNEDKYQIVNQAFNSDASDFAPAYFADDLVFSSSRSEGGAFERKYKVNNQAYLELYRVKGETESLASNAEKFSSDVNSKFHEGVVCFSPDQQTMYFTSNNYFKGKYKKDKNGVNNLKLFIAKREGDSWSVADQFPHNSDEYSVGHPAISADGNTLYFVSDMPGGFGKSDIYKSELKNGQWSTPKNLGKEVNTEESEVFPFVFTDKESERIYFASEGHIGLGGLDIYQTETNNLTAKVENLGAPINSASDDFGLAMKDTRGKGFFSSNRIGGKGDDDIYYFEVEDKINLWLQVRDSKDSLLINNTTLALKDLTTGQDTTYTLSSGQLQKVVEGTHNFELLASKEGYESSEMARVQTEFLGEDQHVTLYVNLIPTEAPETVAEVIEKVNEELKSWKPVEFDFDKYIIKTTSYDKLNQIAAYMKEYPQMKLHIRAHTDQTGTEKYNQRLSKKRAVGVVNYLKNKGVDKARLSYEALGESQPLNDCTSKQCSEVTKAANRRTEFYFQK